MIQPGSFSIQIDWLKHSQTIDYMCCRYSMSYNDGAATVVLIGSNESTATVVIKQRLWWFIVLNLFKRSPRSDDRHSSNEKTLCCYMQNLHHGLLGAPVCARAQLQLKYSKWNLENRCFNHISCNNNSYCVYEFSYEMNERKKRNTQN